LVQQKALHCTTFNTLRDRDERLMQQKHLWSSRGSHAAQDALKQGPKPLHPGRCIGGHFGSPTKLRLGSGPDSVCGHCHWTETCSGRGGFFLCGGGSQRPRGQARRPGVCKLDSLVAQLQYKCSCFPLAGQAYERRSCDSNELQNGPSRGEEQ
jgi:hypothetical protein